MSFNPYSHSSHYSPYYQQSANQQGQSQSTDQSRNSGSYPANTYQPLSAYQNSQHQQSTTSHSTNTGHTYGAQGYGASQAPGTGHDGRNSLDTSALGNLAYASSLGQRNSSAQQVMDYNNAQSPAGYSSSSPYGINHVQSPHGSGHERTNTNGGAANLLRETQRVQTSTSSPSFGYSSNSTAGAQAQRPTPSGNGQSQAQYTNSQQPRPPPPLQFHPNPYNKQPSRPSSGQAVQRPQSRTAPQGVQSPTVPTSQAVLSNIVNQPGKDSRSGTARVPTPQQKQAYQQPNAAQHPTAGPRAGNDTPNAAFRNVGAGSTTQHAAISTNGNQAQNHPSSQKSQNSPSTLSGDSRQANTRNNPNNKPTSQSSTPTMTHSVTTVDPSHVFNDLEYQRRQKAAAAEAEAARKKADDDLVAALGKANTAANVTAASLSRTIPQGNQVELDKKNQMELEMKAMIEKMRDYKSKDPDLFSQVWEDVKKAPPARTHSHSVPQGSVSSPVVIDGQGSGPQLPPESELPAAESFPKGFDRGRYPAQRRRRGNAHYTPPKRPPSAKGTPKGTTKATAVPAHVAENQITPSAGQTSSTSFTPQVPPTISAVAQMVGTAPNHSSVQNSPSSSTPNKPSPLPPNDPARPPPTGSTYWPEDKKRQLAEAAKAALTSAQPNIGKTITADELHDLLDRNPSYTQMCETLEHRGFVIDRGHFARTLLGAVPDLGSATSKTAPPKPHPQPLPQGLPAPSQSSRPAAPPRPVAQAAPYNYQRNPYPSPYIPPSSTTQELPTFKDYRFVGPKFQPDGAMLGQAIPLGPPVHLLGNGLFVPATPRSAPAAAVSKSGVKWADEPSRPLAQSTTKQDMARKRSFGDIVDLTRGLSDDEEDVEPPRQRPRIEDGHTRIIEIDDDDGAAASNFGQDGSTFNHFRHNPTTASGGKYLTSKDVIRPMNKRQDASRRSSYNPKTIARDILISIGKHPTMVPLNSHLEKLRENFAAVSYDSDLSTFRWDLVDPGGPAPPSPPPAQPFVRVGNEDKKAAFKLTPYQPSKQPGSPATPVGPKRAGRPSEIKPIGTQSSSPATSSGPKRIGRPPGAKNKNPRPDKGISQKPQKTSTPTQEAPYQDQGSSRPSQEDSATTPLETPSRSPTTKIPQRPRIQTTPIQSSGLRNLVSPHDGIAVVIPSPSLSIAASRAGSEQSAKKDLPRKTTNEDDRNPPTPSYKVYKCEWEKCPAELHSLEKLRKHIRKHRNHENFKDESMLCLWKNCSSNDYIVPHIPAINATPERDHLRFRSEAAWEQHVERVHIDALAQDLGEGPSTTAVVSPGNHASASKSLGKTSPSRNEKPGQPKSAFKPSSVKPLVVISD